MKNIPILRTIVSTSFALLILNEGALALTPASDNFNTSTLNRSRWSVTNVGSGRLTQSAGQLQFTVNRRTDDDYSYLQLRNNQPGYNENWEVIIDVTNRAGVGEDAGPGLWIYNASDPEDSVFVEFYGTGSAGGFNMICITDDLDDVSADIRKNPRVTTGSMRISFDRTTKQLTTWYDKSGSSNGFQWVKIGTFATNGKGGDRRGDWKMNPGSGRFGVRIGAYSEDTLITKGKISLDNFKLRARR